MKWLGRFIFICLLCNVLSFQALAEELRLLTWEDCVKAAELNHPDLVSAAQQLKQVEADKWIRQSAMLPQVSTELKGQTSKTSTSEEYKESYSYGISGKQLLFDGFKTSNDVGAAKEEVRASHYNYAVVSSNVRLTLRNAFVELLRAQGLISITESIARRRKQNLELVELRYEAGREHKGAMMTAQADFAEAEFEKKQAQRNLLLARIKLVKAIGWQRQLSVKAEGDFVVFESEKNMPDFEYLTDNTPLLEELIAKKEAARYGLKSAKSDFFPQVYLNASYDKTGIKWAPRVREWMAGVSVTFPLFEGGSRVAQVSKQEAKMRQAYADERSGRDNVIITLGETWVGFQDAIDTVSVQKKFLDAAQERAKIALSQYSSGFLSFDNWIIIEDELVRTRKSYLNAQANMLTAEARWIQAKGGILEYVQK